MDSIMIVDPDIDDDIMSVNVEINKGIITFNNTGRNIFNNGSKNVTLTGTIFELNDYLADFSYVVDAGQTGSEIMKFSIDDYGYNDKSEVYRFLTFQLLNQSPVFD